MKLKSNNLFDFDKEIIKNCVEVNNIISGDNLQAIELMDSSKVIIIGTDEVGRGPGAGGVFASAVYFQNPDDVLIRKLFSLNDSKKLSKKKREELYDIILEEAISSTVCVEVEEIEKINILNASLKAMKLSCESVIEQAKVQFASRELQFRVLVDGNKLIKDFDYQQEFIVKGDSKSASIAAASILAKVLRDRYMQELGQEFPQYNWKQNAGYLTREHFDAIDKYGITPIHRKSFLKKYFERDVTAVKY